MLYMLWGSSQFCVRPGIVERLRESCTGMRCRTISCDSDWFSAVCCNRTISWQDLKQLVAPKMSTFHPIHASRRPDKVELFNRACTQSILHTIHSWQPHSIVIQPAYLSSSFFLHTNSSNFLLNKITCPFLHFFNSQSALVSYSHR